MVSSKKKKGISTRVSIVIKKRKLAYNISMPKSKYCSSIHSRSICDWNGVRNYV